MTSLYRCLLVAWALSSGLAAHAEVPVARWSGDLLFISGVSGSVKDGATSVDVGEQTRSAIAGLSEALAAAELDRSRLVSLDIYLENLAEFPAFWSALVEALGGRVPSGAAVGVRLGAGDGGVQLAAVAARRGVSIRRIQPEGWLGAEAPGSLATMAGGVLFISGMAAFDPSTMEFLGGDFKAQVARTLANLAEVLAAAGLGLEHARRCRLFVSQTEDPGEAETAVRKAWGEHSLPQRTVLGVDLLGPGNLFGTQCVASRQREPVRFLGGRLGVERQSGESQPISLEQQVDKAWRSVSEAIRGEGLSEKSLTALTVYLAELDDREKVRALLVERAGPLSMTFLAVRLADEQARVQLEAVTSPQASR